MERTGRGRFCAVLRGRRLRNIKRGVIALETHGETEVRLLRSSQRSLCAPFGLAWRVLAQYCERTRETFRRKVSRSAHRRIFGNDISAKVNGRADTAYTAARTANEMEDTRIYNYIDIIDIPYDDFLGMWYYELDSERGSVSDLLILKYLTQRR